MKFLIFNDDYRGRKSGQHMQGYPCIAPDNGRFILILLMYLLKIYKKYK